MEYIEKKETTDLNVTDILEKYIRSGSVKSIQKLPPPNLYRITIKGTEPLPTFIKIHRHLRKHGCQTKTLSYHRTERMRQQGSPIIKMRIPSDRYIIAKVGAPPEPKDPDDFEIPRSRRSLQKRKRG